MISALFFFILATSANAARLGLYRISKTSFNKKTESSNMIGNFANEKYAHLAFRDLFESQDMWSNSMSMSMGYSAPNPSSDDGTDVPASTSTNTISPSVYDGGDGTPAVSLSPTSAPTQDLTASPTVMPTAIEGVVEAATSEEQNSQASAAGSPDALPNAASAQVAMVAVLVVAAAAAMGAVIARKLYIASSNASTGTGGSSLGKVSITDGETYDGDHLSSAEM